MTKRTPRTNQVRTDARHEPTPTRCRPSSAWRRCCRPLPCLCSLVKIEQWTCPNCKSPVYTPFCPACGELTLHARELTLRGLFDHLFETFTKVDSRLIRSFRYLVSRPGVLTVAYLEGRRKPRIGPVPLFLIVNVLFFATESLTGGNVFTTPLDSHLHSQPWSGFARQLVAHRLETTQTDSYC